MPRNISAAKYSFGVLSFYPPSSASATSGKLLLKHATSIKQYVSFSNHSTIYFYCQSNSSKKSILLTDTSYATLFSVCVSDNFLTYSRLWILPQICTCPPTSKPEANLHFVPSRCTECNRFSIRAVHSDQKICDLSSKRCFPVNWLLTYIAV